MTCASSISQKAALEAVTNGVDDALIMREQYKKRLDYVYDRLVSMGLDVVKPSAHFISSLPLSHSECHRLILVWLF